MQAFFASVRSPHSIRSPYDRSQTHRHRTEGKRRVSIIPLCTDTSDHNKSSLLMTNSMKSQVELIVPGQKRRAQQLKTLEP